MLLVVTSMTLLALDYRGFSPINGAKNAVLTVFGPVRSGADTVFGPVSNAWNSVFRYDDLETENDELRTELEELRGQAAEVALQEQRLEFLREQIDVPAPSDIDRVPAQVIGGPASNFDRTIEIDKGAGSGIEPGMPVVTNAGLAGKVTSTSLTRARVQLVTDPEFRVGVVLLNSFDVGVGRGTGPGDPLVVDSGIHPDTPVIEGELVYTSGLAQSVFPPDVPIGTVSSVGGGGNPLEQRLEVELAADLERLTFVTVLRWEAP